MVGIKYKHMVNNSSSLENDMEMIIDLAQFAPSVHNTQPWIVTSDSSGVSVSIDTKHQLKDGDPTGRQTILSLGIFCEAISIAAQEFGYSTSKISFNNKSGRVNLNHKTNDKNATRITNLLKNRVTDRSIYRPAEISKNIVEKIEGSVALKGLSIHIVTKPDQIESIADMTASGIGLALSNPSFRKELSRYLIVPWSKKQRGISTKSLYIPKVISYFEPIIMRLGWGISKEVDLEKRRWQSSSAIVLITTKGDLSDYWFEAGRAYLRVCLAIEGCGLSQATSAATVEASNYHEDVEKLLGTSERLQAVIRIGRGSAKRNHSPRVSAKSLISSN